MISSTRFCRRSMTPPKPKSFSERLLAWFDVHGRHELPWQLQRTPYTVWLSEVMLQQTQAATVSSYFRRFVERFPDLETLANASDDDVHAHWSGLGYYSRARNLHKAAQICVQEHDGDIPSDFDALLALPGIGRSTAGAIMAQAFGEAFAILDGNVKRVLSRYLGIREWTGTADAQRRMWAFAEANVPRTRVADYTQAQMDLGSIVCKPRKPLCDQCPLRQDCIAFNENLTAVIPAPKPKKERPHRHAAAAVLMQGDSVLLIKRPPAGIWSSLWTLPQADDFESLQNLVNSIATTRPPRMLAVIDHAFSHYDLSLTPVHFGDVTLHDRIHECDAMPWRWLSYGQLNEVGIPAPIRTLLAESILRNDP